MLIHQFVVHLSGYLQPLMDQIDDVSSHAVKSQWLYLLDLGEVPKRDSAGVNVISYSQLPHIITPLEKKLGFGELNISYIPIFKKTEKDYSGGGGVTPLEA